MGNNFSLDDTEDSTSLPYSQNTKVFPKPQFSISTSRLKNNLSSIDDFSLTSPLYPPPSTLPLYPPPSQSYLPSLNQPPIPLFNPLNFSNPSLQAPPHGFTEQQEQPNQFAQQSVHRLSRPYLFPGNQTIDNTFTRRRSIQEPPRHSQPKHTWFLSSHSVEEFLDCRVSEVEISTLPKLSTSYPQIVSGEGYDQQYTPNASYITATANPVNEIQIRSSQQSFANIRNANDVRITIDDDDYDMHDDSITVAPKPVRYFNSGVYRTNSRRGSDGSFDNSLTNKSNSMVSSIINRFGFLGRSNQMVDSDGASNSSLSVSQRPSVNDFLNSSVFIARNVGFVGLSKADLEKNWELENVVVGKKFNRNFDGSIASVLDEKMASVVVVEKKSTIRKCNSCSTLYVDFMMIAADLNDTLKCAAISLVNNINLNMVESKFVTNEIFSEFLHPLSKTPTFCTNIPTESEVLSFLEVIFSSADLNVECAIISLIYIDRMLRNTDITLNSSNWARIVLGGIIIASKVWDDNAVWNIDYCQIFPDMLVEDINNLEKFFLSAIKYNVSVKLSNYAKAYFELRDQSSFQGRKLSKPLNNKDIQKLEKKTFLSEIEKRPSKTGSKEEGLKIIVTDVDTNWTAIEYSEKTLEQAVEAATSVARSSALHGGHIQSKDAADAISADKALKRSKSDYIYVSLKPPATIV